MSRKRVVFPAPGAENRSVERMRPSARRLGSTPSPQPTTGRRIRMQKPVTTAGVPVSAVIRPVMLTRHPFCRVMNPCRISFSQA